MSGSLRSLLFHQRAANWAIGEELDPPIHDTQSFPTLSFLTQVMQIHRDRLRYLSYSLSAPVIATPVFVFLALLEAAGVLDVILSIVFVTIVPRIGIVRSARSSRLDYDIPERSARARPFMIAIASYLVGFLFLMIINAPVLLSGLMLAYSINTTVMFVISPSWKISVLAAVVTGPLPFLVFKLGPAWSLLYLLVVPVALVRIRLQQHTVFQILAGAVLSAARTWAEIFFLVPFIPT